MAYLFSITKLSNDVYRRKWSLRYSSIRPTMYMHMYTDRYTLKITILTNYILTLNQYISTHPSLRMKRNFEPSVRIKMIAKNVLFSFNKALTLYLNVTPQ